MQSHVRLGASEWNLAAECGLFDSQSLLTCLQAVAKQPFTLRCPKSLFASCLENPRPPTPAALEVYSAHRRLRKDRSQLQTQAAPTSPCSCVCMHLGFIPATHFLQHWNILQRTTASFCLHHPVENNCILVRLQAAALHGECRILSCLSLSACLAGILIKQGLC